MASLSTNVLNMQSGGMEQPRLEILKRGHYGARFSGTSILIRSGALASLAATYSRRRRGRLFCYFAAGAVGVSQGNLTWRIGFSETIPLESYAEVMAELDQGRP